MTGIENFGVFVDLDWAPEASVGFIPSARALLEMDLLLSRSCVSGAARVRRGLGSGHRATWAGCPVLGGPSGESMARLGRARGQHRQRPRHEARPVRCLRGSR
ncbi:hypothetical protein ACFYO2_39380 [Streptomyces sp. NPDC006602]|uniref:hypothetical protein n=1 Tax=Streptomyces sp. NPDC006602 TaxID=3364751 RepID=UPI0036B7D1ED